MPPFRDSVKIAAALPAERRVSARRGWAGVNRGILSILPMFAYYPTVQTIKFPIHLWFDSRSAGTMPSGNWTGAWDFSYSTAVFYR